MYLLFSTHAGNMKYNISNHCLKPRDDAVSKRTKPAQNINRSGLRATFNSASNDPLFDLCLLDSM